MNIGENVLTGEEQATHLLRVVALKWVRDTFIGKQIIEDGVVRTIKDVYLPEDLKGCLYELEDA